MMLSLAIIAVLGDTNDLFQSGIPNKMVMGQRIGVEKVDEKTYLANPAASDERIRKVVIDHGVIIDAKNLVDLDLCLVYLLLSPRFFAKDSKSELAIIRVDNSVVLVVGALFDLFDLDVLSVSSTNLFLENQLLGLHRVHLYIRLILVRLRHSDSPSGVLGDHHRLNWVHCPHLALREQVREYLCVWL